MHEASVCVTILYPAKLYKFLMFLFEWPPLFFCLSSIKVGLWGVSCKTRPNVSRHQCCTWDNLVFWFCVNIWFSRLSALISVSSCRLLQEPLLLSVDIYCLFATAAGERKTMLHDWLKITAAKQNLSIRLGIRLVDHWSGTSRVMNHCSTWQHQACSFRIVTSQTHRRRGTTLSLELFHCFDSPMPNIGEGAEQCAKAKSCNRRIKSRGIAVWPNSRVGQAHIARTA